MHNSPSKSSIPINPKEWSEESQRSYISISPPSEYQDKHYNCRYCKRASVFSAEAQREAYEIRKIYIWKRRLLCIDCFRAKKQIEAEIKKIAEQWKLNRPSLKSDKEFIQRWLLLLEKHVRYGAKSDESNNQMLRRLLV